MNAVPRVPTASSESVQEICGYAGHHLLPHVSEFLKIVVVVAPNAPADVDASLHGALVGIVRNLEKEQAIDAFIQICDGTATRMNGVDISQSTTYDILKPIILVLQKVVMSRTISPAAQNIQEVIRVVLFSFHKWPRSI